MIFLLISLCLPVFILLMVHQLSRGGKWVTVYECKCGEKIENGVGKWDEYLFLKEICDKCGAHKDLFERKGMAQIKVRFFKETYIYKND